MARVLVVDPNQESLAALTAALEAKGHDLAVATSGTFALTLLERDRRDLIVSQADIPDISGYELCAIVRSDPAIKDVPFLLLAGQNGPVSGAAARAGVDMVLAGNFTTSDVVRSVTGLL